MPHGKGRRRTELARGSAALVGVVLLAVGVPLVLAAAAGSPLPDHRPRVDAVTRAVADGYVTDTVLVKVLAAVCWLVWFELVALVAVEATAYARGRRAAPVPLAGPLQPAAARLVAGVAGLGAGRLGLAGAAGDAPILRLPVVPLVDLPPPAAVRSDPAGSVGSVDAAPAVDTGAEPPPVYEVGRRDTLWDIAERHLGDPFRWREIYELNRGRPQDGGGCLSDPEVLVPGWRLDLPADAARPGPDQGA